MIKPKNDDENRLKELSDIAAMAHRFGSIEREYPVEQGASDLDSLKIEFKKSVCEREDVQKKLYLSYGL